MSARPALTKKPPPLPPRQGGGITSHTASGPASTADALPAMVHDGHLRPSDDPRSSSQESLRPPQLSEHRGRRTLLAIFIHGFMGNETSFRSFPAHLHNLLTIILAETHVIHTKIYPRYRSKRNISFVRDDFSRWLEPHEHAAVDVVLLGHSMGGLLAAEVVTKRSSAPTDSPFKHRILGNINFDVPFLGMSPGIIKSGLASIFRPADAPPEDKYEHQDDPIVDSSSMSDLNSDALSVRSSAASSQRVDTLWTPAEQDPNFNPAFSNDVVLPVRTGWRNAWHFVNKHSKDLKDATKQLVSSHLEFGGAMANYPELKMRYGRVRILEEESPDVRRSVFEGAIPPPRVRFVNYYTSCTGRPKKVSTDGSIASKSKSDLRDTLGSIDDQQIATPRDTSSQGTRRESDLASAAESLVIKHEEEPIDASSSSPPSTIPDLPQPPPMPDLSFIKDPNTRKLVEHEHQQAMEAYERAAKDRKLAIEEQSNAGEGEATQYTEMATRSIDEAEDAIRRAEISRDEAAAVSIEHDSPTSGRELTQREKEEMRLEKERQRMAAEGRRLRGETEPDAQAVPTVSIESAAESSNEPEIRTDERDSSASESLSETRSSRNMSTTQTKAEKPRKERRFCTLPPEDSNGHRDPCWVKVFMKDVDEVGAHCGLFFIDARYEQLVGEVANKIEEWVRDDMDDRLVRELSHDTRAS